MVTRSQFYFQEEQDNIRKMIKPNVASFPVLAYPSENPQNVFGSASQNLAVQQLLSTSLLITQAQREYERFRNTLLVYQQNLLDSVTINSLQSFKPLIPELKPHHLEAYKTIASVAATPTAYSNSPAPTQISDEIESDSIKKSTKLCSIPKLFEEKTVEARPKTIQSKFKNCYGLSVGRVIKSVKECLRIMHLKGSKGIPENSPYYYIYQVISQLSDYELECFEEYLKGYHTRRPEIKKNRGKSVVLNYLEEGKGHGLVLVGLVISFLEADNKDLQSYINNTTKHKTQVCQVLSNAKDLAQLRNTFREMQHELRQKMEN